MSLIDYMEMHLTISAEESELATRDRNCDRQSVRKKHINTTSCIANRMACLEESSRNLRNQPDLTNREARQRSGAKCGCVVLGFQIEFPTTHEETTW